MTTTITGVHPYADKFPMLPENELAELAESIAANGLRLPVVVTPDGLILDGRNRNEACKRAGVEPATTVYDGDDLAEYVIDANSSRRHMSAGARAMATALVLLDAKGRTNGRWNRDQGPRIGDIHESVNSERGRWRNALTEAGIVLDYAPELAVQVVNGDMALDAAYRQACNNRDAETALLETEKRIVAEEETARTTLAEVEGGQSYLDQVGTTYRTARQAWAAWEDDNHRKAAERRREEARKENDRKQREASMSDLFSRFADSVAYLSVHDGTAVMDQFHPRFVRPKDSLRHLTPEACRAAARFCETIATHMESRQA